MIKNVGFCFLFLVFGFVKAQFKTQYYGDGKVKAEGSFSNNDSLKQGPWRYYYPNGVLNQEGNYFYNKQHGKWITYDLNGKPQKEEYFLKGVQQSQIEFHKNGKVAKRFGFENGIYNGTFSGFYENGAIAQTGYYKIGMPDSVWVSFYENGIVKTTENYKKGKLNGSYSTFLQDGKLENEIFYIDGEAQKKKKKKEKRKRES